MEIMIGIMAFESIFTRIINAIIVENIKSSLFFSNLKAIADKIDNINPESNFENDKNTAITIDKIPSQKIILMILYLS
jgi:hypothetical protein